MSFFSDAWSWVRGSSATAGLARTAALIYAMRLMNKNVDESSNNTPETVDPGVRLQLKPDPQSKIPVLYGSAFFGGNITDAQLSTDYKTISYCLTLAEKTGAKLSSGLATTYQFNDVYLNNNRVVFKADGITVDYTLDSAGNQDISMRDLVKVYMYASDPTQPVGYSGTTPAATSVMPGWTSLTHPMTGLVYAIVQVTYNRAKNITGIPDCKFHLTSNMTLPGDVLYDYMTNAVYGANIPSGEIDSSLGTLNTFCDTGFTYTPSTGGSATAKILINGLVDTDTDCMSIMEELAKAGAAWISYDIHQGKWTTVINKTGTSVASFSDSNIVGEIAISGTSLTQLNNVADVKYQNAQILDKTDLVKVKIPDASLYANEPRSDLQLTLPFTNKQAVALRLGLQLLKQGRVDKIIKFTADYSYMNLRAGDLIDVTSTVFGYTNKLFRIITAEETEGESGSISIAFTCLEYDANVYVYNIEEFAIETDDGFLSIGSIGKPGIPQVTKFERDSRPRILIESVSPSGVVESMEYWLTTDTGVSEINRTYRLIGTRTPTNQTTSTWEEGTNVTYEDDAIGTSDFYIKTRGVNSFIVGPYSDPSGLISYKPVQQTDAIGPETSMFNSTGGLILGLAAVELLGKLGSLFAESDVGKSLFSAIFDTFKDVTGIDLVGEASGGSLVVASDVAIKQDGTAVSSTLGSINFKGPLMATGSDNITVKLKDGTANKDILAWDAANSQWRTISGCITCDFPTLPEPPTPAVPCSLEIAQTLPANNFSGINSICTATSSVPFSGSYFIKFNINPGTAEGGASNPPISLVSPLVGGTGSFKLYGTDGKLEESKSIGNCIIHNDVIEIPFSSRAPGKDYYIIWDEGIVTTCTCENAKVDNATTWTFTTSLVAVEPYKLSSIGPTAISDSASTSNDDSRNPADTVAVDFTTTPQASVCSTAQKLILTFAQKVKKGSGSITLQTRTGASIQTFPVSGATIAEVDNNWTVDFGTLPTLEEGLYFDLIAPRGLLLTDTPASSSTVCDKTTMTPGLPDRKSKAKQWGFYTGAPLEITKVDYCKTGNGNCTLTSSIEITFNKSISAGTGDIIISDGGIFGTVQKIDINGTYANKKYGTISGENSNVLTINPTKAFTPNTQYHIEIPSGVLKDADCDSPWAGVTDSTTIAWKTDGADPTPPKGLTFGSVLFDLEYDRPVNIGYGKMNIVAADGRLITQISPLDLAVKIKYNTRF
jgi:hypothetical protein